MYIVDLTSNYRTISLMQKGLAKIKFINLPERRYEAAKEVYKRKWQHSNIHDASNNERGKRIT